MNAFLISYYFNVQLLVTAIIINNRYISGLTYLISKRYMYASDALPMNTTNSD